MALKKEAEADNKDISQVRTEKIFWETVAENTKEIDFRNIYEITHPDIENGNYTLARRDVNEELKKVISRISPLIYGNNDKRSLALIVLKGAFYKLFPEIESLIEETEEERRAKVKIPVGQLGRKDEAPPLSEGEFREELRNPYKVEEETWGVPNQDELVPGLIITFIDRETYGSEVMELLAIPSLGEGGNLFVKVKWNGEVGLINLADFGLRAYAQTGLWNYHYFPKSWKMKNENK